MKKISLFLIIGFIVINVSNAQEHPDLKIINQIKTTPVKSQYKTNTCWSYTTTSFIETEAIRLGKDEYDLSEMYFVYYTLINKAYDYMRYHGMANFSPGGQAHDVTTVVKKFGLVPESGYLGRTYEGDGHDHSQLEKDLEKIIKDAVKDKEKNAFNWQKPFIHILDSIMGKVPENFEFKGKKFTPKTFNEKKIGFKPEDYIEFTSYNHHPYYESVDLEVPDNWSHDRYVNLPIDELMQVMDHALKNGYSVAWDGDVSEKGMNHKTGLNNLLESDFAQIKNMGYQKYRQKTFDDFSTTDDHLMHLTGLAENKDGKLYYITKNSWGVYNKYGGYLFMSEDYVKIKTVAFMIHKDAVPDKIAKKIGLK